MRRIIALGLLIVINFVLQTTIFGFNSAYSVTPNLMLILTMSFGVMRGRKEGLLVGFFCGFFADCYFTGILGPYMLLYMFMGYINGFFHKNYMVEDVLLPLIIISVDDIVFNFIIYIFTFLLKNRLDFSAYLLHVFLPELLCTSLLTILIYKIYVAVNQYLKRKEAQKE